MGMDNSIRNKLTELMVADRDGILSNNRKLKGLLHDYCPHFQKEIKAILIAFEERIPEELLKMGSVTSEEILLPRLTKKLLDTAPVSEEAAYWAVESWALALKIITPETKFKIQLDIIPEQISQRRPTQPAVRQEKAKSKLQANGDQLRMTLAPNVEMVFVRVPAGDFLMGSDKEKDKESVDNEIPQHTVYLGDYWIGKYPITNQQYQAFIQATKHPSPIHWHNNIFPILMDDHPVTKVSWNDSVTFCKWASKSGGQTVRLPTEAEWEKAARGIDGRIYPWGNELLDANHCSYYSNIGETTPVGRYSPQGDSPYGSSDMVGNVWEWMNDWYDEAYYAQSPLTAPPGPMTGRCRVLRGGGWFGFDNIWHTTYRYSINPEKRHNYIGFRCVIIPGDQPT